MRDLLHHGWPNFAIEFIHEGLIRSLLQLDVLTLLHSHCKFAIQGLLLLDPLVFFLSYLLPKLSHVLTQLFLVGILLSFVSLLSLSKFHFLLSLVHTSELNRCIGRLLGNLYLL